jgi:hypothetical protein
MPDQFPVFPLLHHLYDRVAEGCLLRRGEVGACILAGGDGSGGRSRQLRGTRRGAIAHPVLVGLPQCFQMLVWKAPGDDFVEGLGMVVSTRVLRMLHSVSPICGDRK